MSNDVLQDLYTTVMNRKTDKKEGSYTCYLFEQGLDKILKKIGEECTETVIAAKNGDNELLTGEIADLLYHITVMMAERELPLENLLAELDKRSEKTGNLKQFKTVNKDS
jgi:phosphoribosyl-ATP pyrophosphohydrolase